MLVRYFRILILYIYVLPFSPMHPTPHFLTKPPLPKLLWFPCYCRVKEKKEQGSVALYWPGSQVPWSYTWRVFKRLEALEFGFVSCSPLVHASSSLPTTTVGVVSPLSYILLLRIVLYPTIVPNFILFITTLVILFPKLSGILISLRGYAGGGMKISNH